MAGEIKMISPHFSMAEALTTDTAINNAIPQQDKARILANMTKLAETVLEPWRAISGPLGVNSWYRSKRLNTAIGGEKTSLHLDALAADIVLIGREEIDGFRELVLSSIGFDRAIFEHKLRPNGTESIWIHVQLSRIETAPLLKWIYEAYPGPTGRMVYPRIADIKSFIPKDLRRA